MNLNKAQLLGNLAADAETRVTGSGQTRTRFRVISNSFYTKDGEMVSKSEGHNIVAWGRLAEQCSRLKKGRQVYVEGENVTRSFQDEDGKTFYLHEIKAQTVQFGPRVNTKKLLAVLESNNSAEDKCSKLLSILKPEEHDED